MPRNDKLSYHRRHDKQYKYNPKPLGRKNNRNFIPEDKKTEEYWQKRIKNNVAARKSREERARDIRKKSSVWKRKLRFAFVYSEDWNWKPIPFIWNKLA